MLSQKTCALFPTIHLLRGLVYIYVKPLISSSLVLYSKNVICNKISIENWDDKLIKCIIWYINISKIKYNTNKNNTSNCSENKYFTSYISSLNPKNTHILIRNRK